MARQTKYSLRRLAETLGGHHLISSASGSMDTYVDNVCDDSRRATPGSLFVAISGHESDGFQFIPDALARGATAIVTDRHWPSSDKHSVIRVSDTRRALAILAHNFAGDPADQLRMVGVTGTNGKTTTAWLIHHMLTALGRRAGLMGTIETRIGSETTVASLTTPGPIELSSVLADMVEAGCTDCVMEVSSHALAQQRVGGIRFSAAIFTNLTRDHLDYHLSWDHYLNAKKSLFDSLDETAVAIYNRDDESGARVVKDSHAAKYSYGQSGIGDTSFRIAENTVRGLRLEVDGDSRPFNLVGAFNAYNLTAAYSLGSVFGYDQSAVLDALESAKPVPGRMEQIHFSNDVTAVIDYAHTPDALENVLETLRKITDSNSSLWCVFGCGGDRDRGKRPIMGKIAERIADHVVVTSDNPRTEAPQTILDDIRAGMVEPNRAHWIVDRRAAIKFAGSHANPGDTVALVGKGHETYQVVGRERIHLDDKEEVAKWFA